MKKRLVAMALAATMAVSMLACGGGSNDSGSKGTGTAAGNKTEVGTERSETLIIDTPTATDAPGQFNTYMSGTQPGSGIHQLLSAHLWEMDTAKGEQYGELSEGMPESNEDFTEWTVKLRQGIKWSDGEDVNADDVVFTFNMIKENDKIGASAATNLYVESVEKVDDYTVLFKMTEPFPRFVQRYGITVWGTDYRIVPEHIYSKQEDVTTFKDADPVVAGPYTVKDYDDLGTWILYELREDWQQSTLGVVGPTQYEYAEGATPPKYVWFRTFSDPSTKQMAMINNEVDLLCEVTMEEFETMKAANDNVNCWYDEFPYATPDDPGAKSLVFSHGKGEPFNNPDFRWGICLALDIDNIVMNTFNGAGRVAPIPVMNNTQFLQESYTIPMQEWLENFELDLGDGTTFKPYDTGYAKRMAEKLGIEGTDEELVTMFGAGWWKHDEEAAAKLLNKAGLEKVDGVWNFNGKPFTFEMSYLADGEYQSARGLQAAYNQLQEFGFQCTMASKSSAVWDVNAGQGNFEIAAYWPSAGILKDFYSAISGFDADLIKPVGEVGSGQGLRWNNERATEIIKQLANVDPESEESYELHTEFLKECVKDLPFINFQNGTKFVPTNSTYWNGYPNAENPYNGPWWWWSCFKYMLPNIQPA